MKRTLLFFLFIATVSVVRAQELATPPPLPAKNADPDNSTVISRLDTTQASRQRIFTAVEQSPSFPGGLNKFAQFLAHNIHYPSSAVKDRIQGKVFITFVVETDGTLTEMKVIRGVSDDIDAEALRVVKSSPKWHPGIQNGRPVRVQFTIPIAFSL